MTTTTKALKLAIDTQDAICNFVGSHGQEDTATFLLIEADRALSAVRAALAQPAPQPAPDVIDRALSGITPTAPAPLPAFDMLAHLHRQCDFSARTFGPGDRTAGVCDHIRKELAEVQADAAAGKPTLSEWVDVIILAFDGAWRSSATPKEIVEAIVAKQTKNEGRRWPDWRTADLSKAIEHDRTGEVGAAPLMANGLTEVETAATASVAGGFVVVPREPSAGSISRIPGQTDDAAAETYRRVVAHSAIERCSVVVKAWSCRVEAEGNVRCPAWCKSPHDCPASYEVTHDPALSAQAVAAPTPQPAPTVPEGFKLVAVKGFDDLMYWLDRCERKGHLENCCDLIEPWAAFEYRDTAPQEPQR